MFKGYLNDDPRYVDYYQEKNPNVQNGNSSSMGSTATFYLDDETFKTFEDKLPITTFTYEKNANGTFNLKSVTIK